MPVKKGGKGGGYRWGKAGTKTKLSKAKARAVERAAYASGYKGANKGNARKSNRARPKRRRTSR